MTSKPSGSATTRSPWLIQTSVPVVERSAAKRPSLWTLDLRGAVLTLGRRFSTLPPQVLAGELQAVTDAQHRDAEVEDARSMVGAPGSNTLDGAAREDDRRARGDARMRSSEIVQGWISQ
jgi:hypothetical protein